MMSIRAPSALCLALGTCLGLAACAGPTASEQLKTAACAPRPQGLIQLRSNGCADGHCPVYSVTIYMDHEVDYVGGANVAAVGGRKMHLPNARLDALVTELEHIDFIDVPEHCCDCPDTSNVDGAATFVIDYRPGGAEKEIVHSARCPHVPDAIRALEAHICAATGIAPWIVNPREGGAAQAAQ